MSDEAADAKGWGSRRIWEILFLVGGLIGAFIFSEGIFTDKTGPDDAQPEAAAAWTGPSAIVESREIHDVVEAAASVEAVRTARLSSRVQAQVTEVAVNAGDRVSAGQVLVRISAPELDSRSRSAAAEVGSASARADQAARDRARIEQLVASDVAAPQAAERAREAESVAVAELARARAAARAEADVAAMTTLAAPFDGVIVARHVDPGDLASPGQSLLVVADDAAFRLEASVDERLAANLSVGSTARCIVEAIGVDDACELVEIVPASDPGTRTVLVKAALAPRPDLRSGLFGRLRLEGAARPAVMVPASAVERVGGLTSVRVLDDAGRPRLRNVRLGATHADGVEVLSGLAAGERVALP